MKTRICTSPFFNIHFNLALEDSLFHALSTDEQVLFLWQNDPCIVIGRYQNPWLECRTAEIEKDGLALARRQSGGGTVYHDRGNLCFTFMGARSGFDRRANIELIVVALQKLGIAANMNERLDILVNNHKVSGSAFREIADRSFHHGTLLLEADLKALSRYLAPTLKAHEAKGVKSVRSPVTNLCDIVRGLTIESLENAIAETFLSQRGSTSALGSLGAPIEVLDAQALSNHTDFQQYVQRMASREWLYAASPPFTLMLADNDFELQIQIKGGIITGASGFMEGRNMPLSESCTGYLAGKQYGEKELFALLEAASKYESSSRIAGALKNLAMTSDAKLN